MREHLRSLIEQTRQDADSRTNGSGEGHATTATERLGADAVRLARLAAAVHMAETAQRTGSSSIPAMPGAKSAKRTLDLPRPVTDRLTLRDAALSECER